MSLSKVLLLISNSNSQSNLSPTKKNIRSATKPYNRAITTLKQYESIKPEPKDRIYMTNKDLIVLLERVEGDLSKAKEDIAIRDKHIEKYLSNFNKNQKALKQALVNIFSVSEFYKEILEVRIRV
jgi:hypothetical protein